MLGMLGSFDRCKIYESVLLSLCMIVDVKYFQCWEVENVKNVKKF